MNNKYLYFNQEAAATDKRVFPTYLPTIDEIIGLLRSERAMDIAVLDMREVSKQMGEESKREEEWERESKREGERREGKEKYK